MSFESEMTEYESIEHDHLQAKNRFSNLKFTYKERISKKLFYSKLTKYDADDQEEINAKEAKELLVQDKNKIEEMGDAIKESSVMFYDLESEFRELQEANQASIAEEEALELANERNKLQCNSIKIYNQLQEEFSGLDKEIEEIICEIKKNQDYLADEYYKKLVTEESRLDYQYNNLKECLRRQSQNPENSNKENIYRWYKTLLEIYKKLFNEFLIEEEGDKSIITFKNLQNNSGIKLTIDGQALVEIEPINIPANRIPNFILHKERCLKLNDPRLIMILFSSGESFI